MATIAYLLRWRGPSAVSRLVAFVIVDAIKRHSLRRMSHIGEEVFEGQPAVANSDSSSAPIREPFMFRVMASLLHCIPATINRRIFRSKAVLEIEIAPCASATGRFASSQIARGYQTFISAIASTGPLRPSFVSKNGPTTEAMVCDISKGRHADLPQRMACLEAASHSSAEPFRFVPLFKGGYNY